MNGLGVLLVGCVVRCTLLAAVGFTTLAAAVTCPDTCVMTGTTLAVMLMAVIWDFDKGKKALRR